MGSGFAGIGEVPVVQGHEDDRLVVSQVWNADGNGAELRLGDLGIYMNDGVAVKLAVLLLKAAQPSSVGDADAYRKWVRTAREDLEEAFDHRQGWEYDHHEAPPIYR